MHTLSRLLESHLLHTTDTISLKMEKRFVREQLDIVLTLRERVSKTRSLSSGHEDKTNLAITHTIQGDALQLLLLLRSQLLHIRNLLLIPQTNKYVVHGVQSSVSTRSSGLIHRNLINLLKTLEIDLVNLFLTWTNSAMLPVPRGSSPPPR